MTAKPSDRCGPGKEEERGGQARPFCLGGLLAALVLALLAVGAASAGAGSPAERREAALRFERLAFPLGRSVPEVRRNLGIPLRSEVRRLRSPHDPSLTNTVTRLTYPGLVVEIFDSQGNTFVSRLILTSPRYGLIGGVGPGSSRGALRRELGDPVLQRPDEWTYSDEAGFVDLQIRFRRDRIVRMDWTVYPD